jgi:RNA polymerase sigma-70 factor (ECF subfamily)
MNDDIDQLMRVCGPALFARALSLTRNRADAWDLLQDGLERMLRRCPDRCSAEAIQRSLSVIMRNLNTDRYRAAQRHRQVTLNEGTLLVETPPPAEEPIWSSVEPEQIERCVALLQPHLREAYTLRVEKQLSLVAAAKTLGIPVGTVGTRVHRARRRLRALLLTGEGASAQAGSADPIVVPERA